MRKSSRGNPWHDERGRFTNGPKGVYTCPNDDGTVYAQFFADKDCTDEYDNHEFTPEEIERHGGLNGALDWYLGVKTSEKSHEEYEEQTKRREEAEKEQQRYEYDRNRSANAQAENMIEAKVEDAMIYADEDSGDDYDVFYEHYEPEIRKAVNGCYEEFYDDTDRRISKMNLSEMTEFCSSPKDALQKDADWVISSYFDVSDDTEYLRESLIEDYLEDSPSISKKYEKLVGRAGKENLFSAARAEERGGNRYLVNDMFALDEVKRRGLYDEYIKSNN